MREEQIHKKIESNLKKYETSTKNKTLKFSETTFDLPKVETLRTGISKIDSKFQFSPGFHLIVGSPGVGKSWFCTWLGRQFAFIEKKKSVFFSLEMGESLIKRRLLQQWSLQTEKDFDISKTKETQESLRKDDFIVNFFEERTEKEFCKLVGNFYSEGYRVFLFDHFHQLPGAKSDNKTASEKWGRAFEWLRNQYPDIYLIVFAQPNKASYRKLALQMGDVYESGSLIEKCDSFISLSFSKKQNKDEISDQVDRERIFWVDKNRLSGSSGFGVKIYFSEDANFYGSEETSNYKDPIVEEARRIFSNGYKD